MLVELGRTTFAESFGHLYMRQDLEQFLSEAHSIETWRRRLSARRMKTWIAEGEGGRALGYVVAGPSKLPVPEIEANAREIHMLYVRASAQNRRLGSRLVAAALLWVESRGSQPLYVGVWSGNAGVQRLYARHGFEKVGEYEFPVGAERDREFIMRRPPRA